MLLNFCDPCLRTEVSCSTVSTEGYEVTNLTKDNSKGFLAYSCIKPPIYIDLKFICNIQISHVIIWPSVGAQKSSGFQLSSRAIDDQAVQHTVLAAGYLNSNDVGVLFYRRDIDESVSNTPYRFLRRYIKISDQRSVNQASNLRVCILKTENSVPALGRIEVWGRVSRCCGRDVIASIHSMWIKKHIPQVSQSNKTTAIDPISTRKTQNTSEILENVPEEFLDPITCEIMIQPVTLPSGKIIDQNTLEKHEANEALWGRTLTDPFTGMPFNEFRRPIAASALKSRIDKYLLENSDLDEIKKLPRVLGSKFKPTPSRDRLSKVPETVTKNDTTKDNVEIMTKLQHSLSSIQSSCKKRKAHHHTLPVVAACSKQAAGPSKIIKRTKVITSKNNECIKTTKEESTNIKLDSKLEENIQDVLLSLKRFSSPQHSVCELKSCSCCSNSILYKLPCKHIVCRKVLTSVTSLQCKCCGTPYKTCDPKRIYL